MTLDWRAIRPLNGSRALGFEELCAQLARPESPVGGRFERKAPPDAGVECFSVLSNGSEWGWQAKYFDTLGGSQFTQLDRSVKKALVKHPRLARYFVCVPLDRPDARTEGTKSAMDRWNEHVAKWEGWAENGGHQTEFVWWGSSELLDRLARAENIGRVFFWFGKRGFDNEWFRTRFAETRTAAGPRYTPEAHVELPIAADMQAFGRTESSMDAVKAVAKPIRSTMRLVDGFRDRKDPSRNVPMDELRSAVEAVLEGLSRLQPTPIGELPFRCIHERVQEAQSAADDLLERLSQHAKRHDALHTEEAGRSRHRENPFSNRIYQVHQLLAKLRDAGPILNHADDISNSKLMILDGAAGTGKTHLLCDLSQQRATTGAPTIMLLGQRFASAEAPWQQALHHLDLHDVTVEQFVGALEAAAQMANCRALLIIDAINEGRGRVIWPPHLAAFVAPLTASPWIGVLLSVRSTYRDLLIPEDLRDGAAAVTHHGFEDHEYEATSTFFAHYGLELPSTPLLQPEFHNPLFLKTICRGLRDDGQTRMPRGFHGISAAFDLYLQATNKRLAAELGYNPAAKLVQRALTEIAKLLADRNARHLPIDAAANTVDKLLPGREYDRSLYGGLVSEDLLVEDLAWTAENDAEDIVLVSYERYADHAIADYLLRTYLDKDAPEAAFAEGGGLVFLGEEGTQTSRGLLEALCVQVPEHTGTELPRLVPALAQHWGLKQSFRQSLIWRRLDAFSATTLDVLNELTESVDDYQGTLDVLLTVATLPDHPLNAQFLDRYLRRKSMPDRDASWSIYLHRAWRNRGAVHRIIDWASDLSPGAHLDDRVDELCSIALAWMLTTSNRFLRDRATKSLVSLLTGRLPTAQRLIERFASVNDPYVAERIYTVAYGVVMHSNESVEVGAIAAKVYELVFAGETPSPHILLRDYARGVVERALFLESEIDVNRSLIRPPHGGNWPEIPGEAEIEPYQPKWNPELQQSGKVVRSRNRIGYSVMNDDFARYVIGTNHSSTNWLSLRLDEPPWQSPKVRMAKLLLTLCDVSQVAWQRYTEARAARFQELLAPPIQWTTGGGGRDIDEAPSEEARIQLPTDDVSGEADDQAAELTALGDFLSSLTADQRQEVDSILDHGRPGQFRRPPRFDLKRIQRYVLKRVFDFGWTAERFGHFDEYEIRSTGREASKPERIGKKYQWIAYHEILAYIADRYQYRERFREDEGDRLYCGPWQEGTRDIDPSVSSLSKPGGTGWGGGHKPSWWAPASYSAWSEDALDRDWMLRRDDLPDVADLIASCEPSTESNWLNLHGYLNWRQPHPADVESSDVDRRDFWLLFTAYFVPAGDADTFMTWAKGVDFWGRWMPDVPEVNNMFIGEYGWSPAFRYLDETDYGLNSWTRPGRDCPVSVRVAAVNCSCKPSDFDCSIVDSFSFQLPHHDLLEHLALSWTGQCADFVDDDSALAVFDPAAHEVGPTALLARDDLVRRYLEESDLALCTGGARSSAWTVLGEKRVLTRGFGMDYQGALRISGAYTLQDHGPTGFLNFHPDRLDDGPAVDVPDGGGKT